MENVWIINYEGHTDQARIDKSPSACPHCHKSIRAERDSGVIAFNRELEIRFRCPDEMCRKLFIGYYKKDPGGYYVYSKSSYWSPKNKDFSQHITDISPSFVEIYNQAISAEANNLDQVVGIALRKAIEFLIKDYLISKYPAQSDAISSSLLGSCIEKYVQNEKIKSVAKRAVWLWNDETHYVKRWEDKDLEDLKKLIEISLHWIEMELLTEQYENGMPENK